MATAKKSESFLQNDESFLLEQRKVKALEKLANSVDALTIWFEEINKDEWSERIQWYLSEFYKFVPKEEIVEEVKEEIVEKVKEVK
jgi:phosphoribosylaminoimidazole carboxylase (NCAIR synthetase)